MRQPELAEGLLYIDGNRCRATGGRTFDVVNPWTGQVVGQAADASEADVDAAILAARTAFDKSSWKHDHSGRHAVLERLYEIMMADRDRILQLARIEAGAAIGAAHRAHVDQALVCFRALLDVFGEVRWERDYGRRTSFGYASDRKAVYEAIGVVAAITPWNVPLYVNIGKVVSALLAGCTVVLKPAPDTPGMGAIFGEWAQEAGVPDGVLNVITGADPALAGERLVLDRRVDLVSFTGSTAVGKRIMEQGARTLKRVFLELGGKSAKIILDDAPDFALQVAQSILVFHAGQGCAVHSRLLVSKARYSEALEALQKAYAAFGENWGDFEAPSQVMGPVISRRQLERVFGYVQLGIAEGATLLAGGRLRPDKGAGFFIEPTCFVDVTNDMRIAREEIFGPVLVVISYEDDEDAIRIANDSDYGLSGGVVGGDRERAEAVARRIQAGSISVNGGMCIAGDLPFGGVKASGIGREWGVEGIEEHLVSKVIATGTAG